MARHATVQLSALVSVLSFLYVSHSLERHSLTDRPRLSSLLLLLFSGAICLGASYFSKWLPGSDRRFIDGQREARSEPLLGNVADEPLSKGPVTQLPNRPRKWFLPVAIACIVTRLEVLHLVSYQQQCATPGVECFLCLLLIVYEVFSNRRRLDLPSSEDDGDPWRTIFTTIGDWLRSDLIVTIVSIISACVFSLGTFTAVGQFTRSTYICLDPFDSRPRILALQLLGLLLDAVILTLLWRILVWTRTTKMRIRTLATVLGLSSCSIMILGAGTSIFASSLRLDIGFGSLYAFDVLVDSFACAILLMSATFWVCETSPVTPVAITTFLAGIWVSFGNVIAIGDWHHNKQAEPWVPLFLIVLGTILFTYVSDLRSVIFVKRFAFAFILAVVLIAASITALTRHPHIFQNRHPINDLIYWAHIEHDRWLRFASSSDSLSTAVRTYRERHRGRVPPPKYSEWYEFAAGSTVIDYFRQIDRDLEPFWKLSPQALRRNVDEIAAYPGVITIVIKKGEASVIDTGDAEKQEDLMELTEMISKFSKHLPDMVLPINLSPTPRILPSWVDVHSKTSDLSAVADLISRRTPSDFNQTMQPEALGTRNGEEPSTPETKLSWTSTWASDFRQMQFEACPPGSRSRTNPRSDISRFCQACVKDHSRDQLLADFQKSLDVCSQPDLKYLHGFSMTDPRSPPIRKLLPLFGPSKTDEFSDIIIPLPKIRLQRPDDTSLHFNLRFDKLFWDGSIGKHAINSQVLRGGHKLRLLHLVNDSSDKGDVVMILPRPEDPLAFLHRESPNKPGKKVFIYRKVRLSEANRALPFDVGINDYSMCMGDNCDLIKQTYGTREGSAESLEYRYVLLTDEDDGPPAEVMQTLQSGSVPFISTIFRTWYTERLMPWLHFVPIDVRYQALHTTFAYFKGTKSLSNEMEGRDKDGEWIAKQGKRWAEKALAQKDMEIYLFRLLLEWGRLIDDDRDKIGYWQDAKGEFQSRGWARGGQKAA